jgi:hypothetical protein
VSCGRWARGHASSRESVENRYCELQREAADEFLNGDLLLVEGTQILTERWRVEYSTQRPHSAWAKAAHLMAASASEQTDFATRNCDVDSHNTWYKNSVRSNRGPSLSF